MPPMTLNFLQANIDGIMIALQSLCCVARSAIFHVVVEAVNLLHADSDVPLAWEQSWCSLCP